MEDKLRKLVKEALIIKEKSCSCGCNSCGDNKAPHLNESLGVKIIVSKNMQNHLDSKKPLHESILPRDSKDYLNLITEARYLYSRFAMDVYGEDKKLIENRELNSNIDPEKNKEITNYLKNYPFQTNLTGKQREKQIDKIIGNLQDKFKIYYEEAKKYLLKYYPKEKISENTQQWQVIFYDDYTETPVKQLFNSKKEAEKYADGLEYDFQDIVIDDNGEDTYKTFYRYYNEEDKHFPFHGYEVKPVESLKENRLREIITKVLKENSMEKAYKVEGKLVSRKEYNLSAILSDIRALTGITIVKNKEYISFSPNPNYDYSYIIVRIDPSPFLKHGKFDVTVIDRIIKNIKGVKGVITFNAEPELVSTHI